MYLSTRNDLQKQAIVQEFMLTEYFVDHKGRVSKSIQKAFLQLMVNSFKSFTSCIQGRAEQCDRNADFRDLCKESVFSKRGSKKIRSVPRINLVINYEEENRLPSIPLRTGRSLGVHWQHNPIQKLSSLLL